LTKTNQRESFLTRIRNLVAGDGGFTLLETLAVMVIVGLLAAITVPQISKWREKAYVTSIKTDARNLASAIEADYVDNTAYPVAAPTINLSAGNTVSAYAITGGGTGFTFKITSDKVSTGGQKVGTYNSIPPVAGNPNLVLTAS
jgi:prepilin-type N-terminal cleavage/methylation domain-containing protein